MSEISFQKYVGAGNDFVVVDNRELVIADDESRNAFVKRVCDRRFGIGADGVLLLEKSNSDGIAFHMRYNNADGTEVATCGNGSRCLAMFAFENGIAPADMTLRTRAGDYHAQVKGDSVAMSLPDPTDWRTGIEIFDDTFEGEVHFLNTGNPHVVVFVDDVDAVDVERVGAHLRYHAVFDPPGANINFVQVQNPHAAKVRTYERGVEGETLACGTGSVACAIVGTILGLLNSPVHVTTRSGMILEISFDRDGDADARNVLMTGPAQRVFSGVVEV